MTSSSAAVVGISSANPPFFAPSGTTGYTSIAAAVKARTAYKDISFAAMAKSTRSGATTTATTTTKKRKSTSTSAGETTIKSRPKRARSELSDIASSVASSSTSQRRSTQSSRQSSRQRTPELVYRSSRSRSASAFLAEDRDEDELDGASPRQLWTEEDGSVGNHFLTSHDVVKNLMRSYKAYFKNLDDPDDKSFEPHESDYPYTELEYPNDHGAERFILLQPKDKDHYNPIMCLQNSLHTIIEHYLTPEQQSLFGRLPSDSLVNLTESMVDVETPPMSPSPSPASFIMSLNSPLSTLSTLMDSDPSSPCPAADASPKAQPITQPITQPTTQPQPDYLRCIQRAINRHDGPLFVKTIYTVNRLLRMLKYPKLPVDPFEDREPNYLMNHIRTWSFIPTPVVMRVVEEAYQRTVGPNVGSLHAYAAFSSHVYGELMPTFISDIVTATRLRPGKLLLDLGCGVGNVCVQVSLQSGCDSYGIEILPAPAKIARGQLEHFRKRTRMWGLTMGNVELEEGDMLQSTRVNELMSKADVVLVNNKVFAESLNEALRPKFLDLKEGALVVSLKPFVSSINARVTERNVDDISAIFDVTEHTYHSGSVSWGSGGGSYYIHRVDREGYAGARARYESARRSSRRGGS